MILRNKIGPIPKEGPDGWAWFVVSHPFARKAGEWMGHGQDA